MKIYLLSEMVDLGSHVVDVYKDRKKVDDEAKRLNKQYDKEHGPGASKGIFGSTKYFVIERDLK